MAVRVGSGNAEGGELGGRGDDAAAGVVSASAVMGRICPPLRMRKVQKRSLAIRQKDMRSLHSGNSRDITGQTNLIFAATLPLALLAFSSLAFCAFSALSLFTVGFKAVTS